MRLGIMDMHVNRGDLAAVGEAMAEAARLGAASFWVPNFFGLDALTCLAVIGRDVPGIALGTAVVPVLGRHPFVLAQQALTVQVVTAGRLTLGVGLSHRPLVEQTLGNWPASPVGHMDDYLLALGGFLGKPRAGGPPRGLDLRAVPAQRPVPVVLAALGPRMLEVAGRRSDGVVLWCVGPRTAASLTVPAVQRAAEGAGRPPPRIVAGVPVCVADDPAAARAAVGATLGRYDALPSYRGVLGREGVGSIADLALVGREEILAGVERYREAGVTELLFANVGAAGAQRAATAEVLSDLLGSERAGSPQPDGRSP